MGGGGVSGFFFNSDVHGSRGEEMRWRSQGVFTGFDELCVEVCVSLAETCTLDEGIILFILLTLSRDGATFLW